MEYEIERDMPPRDGFTQTQLDQITQLIQQTVQAVLQSQPMPAGPPGPTGPPGPQGEPGPAGNDTFPGSKFSPKEIGFFSPRLSEQEGKGDIVQIGTDTYIRDVYYFIERIKDVVRHRGEIEVKSNLTQCLRGAAIEWYTDTLTPFEKEALRTGPIKLWYDRLESKWKEPTTVAVKQVLSAQYTLEDASVGKDIGTYIHHVMRHANPANITDRHTQLSLIYSSIHPILRGLIPAPTRDTTTDSFIQACEAQQEIWQETAKFHLPTQRQPQSQARKPAYQPSKGQYGLQRYNPRPFRSQDTYNLPYRTNTYQLSPRYDQQGGYQAPYAASNQGKEPTRSSLPPARQPLQITAGNDPSSRTPAEARPYGTNPPTRGLNQPGLHGRQANLRPF